MRYNFFLIAVICLCLGFTGLALNSIGQSAKNKDAKKAPIKVRGIRFIENMLPAAVKQAKAARKYIFVDAYADWCGPCKLLKSSTFVDSQVATFFNSHFVNVAIDMEKGAGIALSEEWNIQAYPTLLILDSTGKVVFRTVGFLRPKELIEFGRQGLNK